MMKNLKYIILLTCFISTLFITKANAQVYSDGALFYIQQDRPLTEGSRVYICRFVGDNMYVIHKDKSFIGQRLSESMDYYDDLDESTKRRYDNSILFVTYELDNDVPSSSRTVYSDDYRFNSNHNNDRHFYAVSEDMSSLICFCMDRYKTKIKYEKIYYIKIDKEDLLPKALNPDEFNFLND